MKTQNFLAGILVLLLSISLVVYATSYPGNQTAFYLDVTSRYPYSYIVEFRNSTYIQAVNGTTGKADYVSTNASYIFNEAVDDLETAGGSVYVKSGSYVFDTPITITPPAANWELNIIGEESKQTVFTGSASLINNTILNCTLTLWNPGGTYWRRYLNLKQLTFVTTGNEAYAIRLPCINTFIEDVYVKGALTNNLITGNVPTFAGSVFQAQVLLGGSAPSGHPSVINGLQIDSSASTTNTSASMLWSWFEGLEVTSMTFEAYTNAIYLWRSYGLSTHVNKFNVVIDNVQVTSGVVYAVGDTGGEQRSFDSVFVALPSNTIGGNYFLKVASDYAGSVEVNSLVITNMTAFTAICKDAKSSTSSIFRGYGFEEWGVNATAADGGQQTLLTTHPLGDDVITVGLYGTPTYVFVTSGNSSEQVICGALSFAADHFHYELNNDAGTLQTGQTVYWYCVYDP